MMPGTTAEAARDLLGEVVERGGPPGPPRPAAASRPAGPPGHRGLLDHLATGPPGLRRAAPRTTPGNRWWTFRAGTRACRRACQHQVEDRCLLGFEVVGETESLLEERPQHYWIGPTCPGATGGGSPSALAVMSNRSVVAQLGSPSIWYGWILIGNRTSSRNGMFSAVKRPPGCMPNRMKFVPDLFGLMAATSNEERAVRFGGRCLRVEGRHKARDWQTRQRTMAAARRPSHTKPRLGYERYGRRFTAPPVRTIRHRRHGNGWLSVACEHCKRTLDFIDRDGRHLGGRRDELQPELRFERIRH